MWDGAGVSSPAAVLDPGEVAATLVAVLPRSLGTQLLGVVGFGSWVHGDFEPARSDIDLLAVLHEDPGAPDVERLRVALEDLLREHPGWRDRLEVGLVSPTAVREVVEAGVSARLVGRLSPGEPLHLVPAERRRLLDWDAAGRGRTLHGDDGLLPPVPWPLVRQVLLAELTSWPGWLGEVDGDDALAYAALTVARSAAYARTGTPHSKRAGARWLAAREARWGDLLGAAEEVWYLAREDASLDRVAVAELVHELARWAERTLAAG